MAEQIPYCIVASLTNRLNSFAFREIGRVYDLSSELDRLKATIESIQAVLSDAEQKQDEDQVIVHWIRKFKEVLHEADDLIDALAIKDLRRKVSARSKATTKVRDFFSSENPLVFRAKLAREILEIRRKFDDVVSDTFKLNLRPSLVVLKQNENVWRETSCYVLQSAIIGREESKNKIIDLLMQTHTNQNVSLIAIAGMGGLGKTALAQLVYNDDEVRNFFEIRMWVCVSEDFEVKVVIKKMLKSFNDDEGGDPELNILQQKLQKALYGKRYMLILDDVWNENLLKWNVLKTYLMCGANGSKILVTTRSLMVAQTMGINNPYVLEGLTKEQSWALLKNMAFGDHRRIISPNLVSIGKRIAEKCGGVPLAIITIGGLLQSKNEESEWLNILEGGLWKLCKERETILPVLKLSYQSLPLALRQCFAYCSLYPKGWRIQKDELIQLWMAQGYLESSTGTKSMEEVGNEYVNVLLMRSFFQEASMSEYNDITSFKMNDLMHDLAVSIAGDDCYLDSEGKGFVRSPMHVSFISTLNFSLDSLDASKVRTILSPKTRDVVLDGPSIIKNLKYLRVLDLSYSSITKLPESIDNLNHLRYVDFTHCRQLTSLPRSVGNIVNLQTLKLHWCTELVFPVEIITMLMRLSYLDIDDCKAFEDTMPAGLRKLTSLQFLSNFAVGDGQNTKCGNLNELKDLNNIKGKLKIHNLKLVKDVASESQEANLKAKKYIQWLGLFWERDVLGKSDENQNSDSLQLLDNLCPHQNLRELTVGGYPGVQFSSWLSLLTNIVEINLVCFSSCQHLPPVERLPWLKRLYIFSMDELKYMNHEEISDMFFPSLEKLILVNCINLNGWRSLIEDDIANDIHSLPAFPRLSSLEIYNCPKLTCMPTYPHLIEKLELRSSSLKPLSHTCLVQLQSSSLHPLSGLKHLDIGDIDTDELPENWMQNLTSLQRLSLCGSSIIRPLSQHLQHLPTQLEQLDIRDINEDGNTQTQWQPPHALRALQSITIQYCQNLTSLLEWTCHIQSLRRLEIWNCPDLESLPEGMRCFTNLHTLYIRGCPLMLDRCKTEMGQDWPKISHIPNIVLQN